MSPERVGLYRTLYLNNLCFRRIQYAREDENRIHSSSLGWAHNTIFVVGDWSLMLEVLRPAFQVLWYKVQICSTNQVCTNLKRELKHGELSTSGQKDTCWNE